MCTRNAYMYAFAINIVVSSIDAKLCTKKADSSNDNTGKGQCGAGTTAVTNGKNLADSFNSSVATKADKIDATTSKALSGEVAALSREEKGTVASVFAKVIEGAEVLETKGVSATSVMVNACYDLVSESIGVVPYAS